MKLANKNAIPEAIKLYEYLCALSGKGILTGQHTQTRGMEEIGHIQRLTGKKPALCGFELLGYSPNINYEDMGEACRKEVEENQDTLKEAMRWAEEEKGIITFTWHWFSPLGGRDKSFYTENTDFDADRILVSGSVEEKAFYHDMDIMAELLRPFLCKKIPILWRPFHEADGTWFWWGAKGVETAKDLYLKMFRYFTEEKKLHNLIWVWNAVSPEGYPGDAYVDIVSRDIYSEPGSKTDYAAEYRELIRNTTAQKPAALAEIGILPDIKLLSESKIPWIYYMTWSGKFVLTEEMNSSEELQNLFGNAYSIDLNTCKLVRHLNEK